MSSSPVLRHRRPFAYAAVTATASLTLVGVGAIPATASPADPGLATAVAKVMRDSRVTKGTTGVVVLDATDARELYQRNGSRAITPASNTKIVTAVAAMNSLGPTYQFKTEVIRRARVVAGELQGNLYLKGYGDPTARQSDYRLLAEAVRTKGIRKVTGALAVDVSYFDNTRYNPTWSKAYADDYYAAEVSALTIAPNADLDAGTVFINYAPGKKGARAKISFTPAAAGNYIRVNNKTTTSSRGTSSTFSAQRSYGSNTITVGGRVPLGRAKRSRLITVDHPELYAAAVFRAELKRVGISVAKATKIKPAEAANATVVAADRSITLSALLVPFLKLSNNMHAEALTKAMGAKSGRGGTWPSGLAVTRAYMTKLGAPMAGVSLSDGSGLTRANKLTARALTRVLFGVQREKWFPAFRAALPVAGNTKRMVGGTLRHRMNHTRAANNARAKTGTLSGVTSLSGYVTGRDDRRYVFAMLSNYSGRTPRPVENTFVVTLANRRR